MTYFEIKSIHDYENLTDFNNYFQPLLSAVKNTYGRWYYLIIESMTRKTPDKFYYLKYLEWYNDLKEYIYIYMIIIILETKNILKFI